MLVFQAADIHLRWVSFWPILSFLTSLLFPPTCIICFPLPTFVSSPNCVSQPQFPNLSALKPFLPRWPPFWQRCSWPTSSGVSCHFSAVFNPQITSCLCKSQIPAWLPIRLGLSVQKHTGPDHFSVWMGHSIAYSRWTASVGRALSLYSKASSTFLEDYLNQEEVLSSLTN